MLNSIDTIKTVSFESSIINKLDSILESTLNSKIQSEYKKNSLLIDSIKYKTDLDQFDHKDVTRVKMLDYSIQKTSELDKIKEDRVRYQNERNQLHKRLKNLDPNYAKTFEDGHNKRNFKLEVKS